MSSEVQEKVDIVNTAFDGCTIRVSISTYRPSGTLEGERLKQYKTLVEECKTSTRQDEEGRTKITRERVRELGLTYPVLDTLTRQGYIKWGMCGNAGIDIRIVERKEGEQGC